MNNYKRDDGAPREMFKAVCSKCKANTEVPFKPSGDKPILCRDCYIESKGGERSLRGRDSKPNYADKVRENGVYRKQISADDISKIQIKLDKIDKKIEKLISLIGNKSENMEENFGSGLGDAVNTALNTEE